MRNILIFGAGGLAAEIFELIAAIGDAGEDMRCEGFVVDPEFRSTSELYGRPVLTLEEGLAREGEWVLALGNSALRLKAERRLTELRPNLIFSTLVHPGAWIGRSVRLGPGSIVLGPASVTARVEIGAQVLVNPGCTIAHDCRVDAFASLSPGVSLAGGVIVAEGAFIGTGAVVIPLKRVGAWSTVAAGAVVVQNVSDGATVRGVPARLASRK
jgi:sugar O-acyltransferase (sialic acid O-acetyltransferase NeuD family)